MNRKERRITPKEYINSYWCPECGNLINIGLSNSIEFNIEYEEDVEIDAASVDFYIICSKCDSYMLQIDYLISKQIKELNDIGYNTAYCCSGHLNTAPDLSSINVYKHTIELPYISFYNNSQNDYAKHIVKRLLTLQEFGFIEFEENDETWVVRGIVNDIEHFSDVRDGFIRFINILILSLGDGKEGD